MENKTFNHLPNGSNGVHIYECTHMETAGKYFMRGNCKGLNVGDTITRFDKPDLVVANLLIQQDAKGVFTNPDDRVMPYFEAEITGPYY